MIIALFQRRFNKRKNKVIELNKGEKFCDKCKGKGVVLNRHKALRPPYKTIKYLECNKCLGAGKLDWVEEIVGKNPRIGGVDGCDQPPT